MTELKPILQLLLIPVCCVLIWACSTERARHEAGLIKASEKELGFWWHVNMWLNGKAPSAIWACLLFAVPALPDLSKTLLSAFAMGFTSMMMYWYRFDQVLSVARGYDRWYISFDAHTALTDKLLREVMWRMKWTPEQTHKRVKLPLICLGLIACALVVLV